MNELKNIALVKDIYIHSFSIIADNCEFQSKKKLYN